MCRFVRALIANFKCRGPLAGARRSENAAMIPRDFCYGAATARERSCRYESEFRDRNKLGSVFRDCATKFPDRLISTPGSNGYPREAAAF
jgi:hypothetical protein